MRLRLTAVILVAALASTSGCIANMGDLKEALGVVQPAAIPDPGPDPLPPLARAQANLTTVSVGAPVRFTSEGTRDPQGLALDLAWSFGDGATATGASATHAFAAAGEHVVRLTATSAAGLSDVAALTVQVLSAGRAPVACFEALDGSGRPAADLRPGDKVVLDPSCSADPDGDGLAYEWDLSGATSRERKAAHAFAQPGLHEVRLTVTDPTGRSAQAVRVLPVGYRMEETGAFEPAGPSTLAHAFPLAAGATSLKVTLSFPAGLGANELTLVLRDAKGDEVDRVEGATPPASQDEQVRALSLSAADLGGAAPGEWTVEVVMARGLAVEYRVNVVEAF